MKITFIGQLYSDIQIQTFLARNWKLDIAADTLQRLIIKGLRENGADVDVVSFPRVPSFPTAKESIFKSININSGNSDGLFVSLGFINLPIFKYISKSVQLFAWIRKHCACRSNDAIIIYSLHSPLLLPFLFCNSDVPIILVVPDLPQYMSSSKNILYRFGKKIDLYILKRCLAKVDGFVLLSEYMNLRINKRNKPWTLMEGICNNYDLMSNMSLDISYPYILYTGALEVRYGVLTLVEAFIKIKNREVRLILCGHGDAESEIKRMSELHDDIIFMGQIPRAQAIYLQKNARLLVNPRTSHGEFTKYSFPSKTMEYLVSGTPTLMYRLPGIPEEYYKYFFSPKDETIEALSAEIEYILQIPEEDMEKFALNAKEFVLNKKNPRAQAKKIIYLLSELSQK